MDDVMTDSKSIAGWIVSFEGRDVAAGPTRKKAFRNAREVGFKGGDARPAGAREIDALELPDAALGIVPEDDFRTDGGRWWATGHCGMMVPDPDQDGCWLPRVTDRG